MWNISNLMYHNLNSSESIHHAEIPTSAHTLVGINFEIATPPLNETSDKEGDKDYIF